MPLESGRHFGIGVVAHYTDGTTGSTRWIKFNPHYSAGWQYTSGTVGFDTPKTIASVDVFCAYEKNANSVLFDCVQVNLDETGVSYTYDAKGNMISAKDNAGRNQTFTYRPPTTRNISSPMTRAISTGWSRPPAPPTAAPPRRR